MIQNHPLCPKSAMEKYYMEQQLPKYQKIPPQKAQKKNHLYNHDNSNIWNNQHQSSSNMKEFAKIQEYGLRSGKHIQQLKKKKHKGQQQQQMSKHYFNQLKNEDHLRMQTHKLERAGLKNLSQQQQDIEADQYQLNQYNTILLCNEDQQIKKYLSWKWKQLNLLRNTLKSLQS